MVIVSFLLSHERFSPHSKTESWVRVMASCHLTNSSSSQCYASVTAEIPHLSKSDPEHDGGGQTDGQRKSSCLIQDFRKTYVSTYQEHSRSRIPANTLSFFTSMWRFKLPRLQVFSQTLNFRLFTDFLLQSFCRLCLFVFSQTLHCCPFTDFAPLSFHRLCTLVFSQNWYFRSILPPD